MDCRRLDTLATNNYNTAIPPSFQVGSKFSLMIKKGGFCFMFSFISLPLKNTTSGALKSIKGNEATIFFLTTMTFFSTLKLDV